MEQIIYTELKPIKLWLNELDEGVLFQVKNLANLPFTFSHVCLMPDAHSGYGMPIGGVLATKNAIIPNAVGVDIGCGMCAVRTSIKINELTTNTIMTVLARIRQVIPLGFNHHKDEQDENLMPKGFNIDELYVVKEQYLSALKQIGTLGGGNHFIEIQKDQSGRVWIMIHSGSRNIGLKVAEYYNNKAKKLNSTWHSVVNSKVDLAFLPFNSDDAKDYFTEMNFCISFALANRMLMIQRVCDIFLEINPSTTFDPIINIAHNYAAVETHFGEQVIVHRKGATSAKEGEIGIIPGSQGTKSYIVEGLGNQDSFMSCSHGAGRLMSRNQAIKALSVEEEVAKLDALGIIHSIRSKSDLEEATSAYKNIDDVMNYQKDLVKIKITLSPLAVIKG